MRLATRCPHLPSTAEALIRVFVPTPRPGASISIRRKLPISTLAVFHTRHASSFANARGTRSSQPLQSNRQPSNEPIRDEGIAVREIQIVNDDKSLRPTQSLQGALASIDRSTYFIIQVGDKVHPRYAETPRPEAGAPDTRPRIPVCKIVDKRSFRLSQAEKRKPKKNAALLTKQIELNWAISQHDLNHRLDRLKEFLNQGKRVEVVFGRKRKGWMQRKDVTEQEAHALLHQIREAVKTVEGSNEWQKMNGQVRGALVVFFEAKKDKP
ncbi:MAG: hypothetical protein Q9218_001644 [Villophora microphyllina]